MRFWTCILFSIFQIALGSIVPYSYSKLNLAHWQIVELPNHPYYIGTQFHPEFKSRPGKPSALFLGSSLTLLHIASLIFFFSSWTKNYSLFFLMSWHWHLIINFSNWRPDSSSMWPARSSPTHSQVSQWNGQKNKPLPEWKCNQVCKNTGRRYIQQLQWCACLNTGPALY
jgi:hypothetical protein